MITCQSNLVIEVAFICETFMPIYNMNGLSMSPILTIREGIVIKVRYFGDNKHILIKYVYMYVYVLLVHLCFNIPSKYLFIAHRNCVDYNFNTTAAKR